MVVENVDHLKPIPEEPSTVDKRMPRPVSQDKLSWQEINRDDFRKKVKTYNKNINKTPSMQIRKMK